MTDDGKWPTITVVFSEGPIESPAGGAKTYSIRAAYLTERHYKAVCEALKAQRIVTAGNYSVSPLKEMVQIDPQPSACAHS